MIPEIDIQKKLLHGILRGVVELSKVYLLMLL